MRTLLIVAFVAAASNASGQSFGVGGFLPFEQKCASCHVKPEAGSRAPAREQLQGQPPESILAAMTTGPMAPMASGLTEAQMRAIAEYVSGRAFGTAAAGHASSMTNQCAAKPLGNPLAGPAWNGWGVDAANTRFQPADAAGLTPATVPKLALKWAFGFPEGRQAFGQPTVVGGRIYVGSDNGFVYSLDAATGCVYWSYRSQGRRPHRHHRGANRRRVAVCRVLRRHQGQRLRRRR